MIHQKKCYCATCDNCGEIFDDGEYSMFPLESDVLDSMGDNYTEWYAGDTDPDHQGKHYCPECFKYDEDIDDKIIVDLSRKQEAPQEAQPPAPSLQTPHRILETVKVQFETLVKKPGDTVGYLHVQEFQAYDEHHLREVMKSTLGYYPPIYYVIPPTASQERKEPTGNKGGGL